MPRRQRSRQKWRQKFYARLRDAMGCLCDDKELSHAHGVHSTDFKRLLTLDTKIANEMKQLSRLEFEAVAIASTKHQWETDLPYFSAAEVHRAFEYDVNVDRRNEVRRLLRRRSDGADQAIVLHAYESTPDISTTTTPSNESRLVAETDISHIDLPTYSTSSCCDARSLLCIIRAAGGIVPKSFGQPAWTWGESGEATLVEGPVPEVLSNVERQTAARKQLLKDHSLLMYNTEGSLAVNPETQLQMMEHESIAWKQAAIAAVCWAFPRWPNPKPASAAVCKTLIPLLTTVLSYLPQLPALQAPLKRSVAEVCISASYFGLLPWKEHMLSTAERHCDERSDDYLTTQLRLRQRMLKRLRLCPDANQIHESNRRQDPYSNALFGREIVLEAKQLLYNDSSLDNIRAHLSKFQPGNSTFEQRIALESKAVLARAYKNRGDFIRADQQYKEILEKSNKIVDDLTNDCLASYAETLCELHHPDKAISLLNDEARFHIPAEGSRLRLALAYAYLTKGLLNRDKALLLNEAYCKFTQYLDQMARHPDSDLTLTMKCNLYTAYAGKAIAWHLLYVNGLLSKPDQERLNAARTNWHDARRAAQGCWPQPGFAEMITLYSLIDLQRYGDSMEAGDLRQKAEFLRTKTAIQYHFVLQGTSWLQWLTLRDS